MYPACSSRSIMRVAAGQAAARGELSGGHGVALVQQVEVAQVGAVDAEARGDQLVVTVDAHRPQH
jgi:hypothetical protein